MADPNHPLSQLATGYPKLAGQMALLPEAALFRTFSALNTRNLLYRQAELIHLENKLLECEKKDSLHQKRCDYAVDWFWLQHSQYDVQDGEQYRLVQEIQGKLKEYSKC
jgi:hypothetical protein